MVIFHFSVFHRPTDIINRRNTSASSLYFITLDRGPKNF